MIGDKGSHSAREYQEFGMGATENGWCSGVATLGPSLQHLPYAVGMDGTRREAIGREIFALRPRTFGIAERVLQGMPSAIIYAHAGSHCARTANQSTRPYQIGMRLSMGNGMEAGSRRGAPRRLCEVCRGLGWYAQEAMGGGIFALRRPRPYSRRCGEDVAGNGFARHLRPCGRQRERRRGG